MPQLNGAEAAVVLKNEMPETPVILFTLNTDLYADAVCAALRVDFISKVDGLPKLIERVDALLPANSFERRSNAVLDGAKLAAPRKALL